MDKVCVQTDDFDVASLYHELQAGDASAGAVVMFVGKVRDFNQGHGVQGLFLEHYPAMTERYLQQLLADARRRWPLNRVTVLHRVGALQLTEQIVFVGVTSPHREAAFAAAQYLMDILKTRAPFWKKELTAQGEQRWVDANQKDQMSAARWREAQPLASATPNLAVRDHD